jgi:hypothetical protein
MAQRVKSHVARGIELTGSSSQGGENYHETDLEQGREILNRRKASLPAPSSRLLMLKLNSRQARGAKRKSHVS